MFAEILVSGGNEIILRYVHEAILAIALSVGGYFLMFPVRYFKRQVKEKFALIDELHDELVIQRTNCLTTLQSQGNTQIVLLGKMNDTLERIHEGQTEMSGFLKGLHAK